MPSARPVMDRIADLIAIDPITECWNWQGTRTLGRTGYGQVKLGSRMVVVHRVTYEHFVGPVPEGMQLDHLCRNPGCSNPDHLEAVTASENVRRYRRLQTHCPKGHLYVVGPGEAHPRCKECRLESGRRRSARYAAKKREATDG